MKIVSKRLYILSGGLALLSFWCLSASIATVLLYQFEVSAGHAVLIGILPSIAYLCLISNLEGGRL